MEASNNNNTKQGRVDLSGLDFVRIKCIFIAALVICIVILRTEQVPIIMLLHNLSTCIHAGINEKNAFKRILLLHT